LLKVANSPGNDLCCQELSPDPYSCLCVRGPLKSPCGPRNCRASAPLAGVAALAGGAPALQYFCRRRLFFPSLPNCGVWERTSGGQLRCAARAGGGLCSHPARTGMAPHMTATIDSAETVWPSRCVPKHRRLGNEPKRMGNPAYSGSANRSPEILWFAALEMGISRREKTPGRRPVGVSREARGPARRAEGHSREPGVASREARDAAREAEGLSREAEGIAREATWVFREARCASRRTATGSREVIRLSRQTRRCARAKKKLGNGSAADSQRARQVSFTNTGRNAPWQNITPIPRHAITRG
jgi:hypothetical protein